jgi:plastocyanin
MTTRYEFRSTQFHVALAFVAGSLIGGTVWAAGAPERVVSQVGRVFTPRDMTIKKGESIFILNDDADLLHHVYVDSDLLNFDSGDQKPGSRTKITFPVTGDFNVLCAIHPKMKLVVHVK